jgi:hypothetical protein
MITFRNLIAAACISATFSLPMPAIAQSPVEETAQSLYGHLVAASLCGWTTDYDGLNAHVHIIADYYHVDENDLVKMIEAGSKDLVMASYNRSPEKYCILQKVSGESIGIIAHGN